MTGVGFLTECDELRAFKKRKATSQLAPVKPSRRPVQFQWRLWEASKSVVTLKELQELLLYLVGDAKACPWMALRNRSLVSKVCVLVLRGLCPSLYRNKGRRTLRLLSDLCPSTCGTTLEAQKPQTLSFMYELFYRKASEVADNAASTGKGNPESYVLDREQLLQCGYMDMDMTDGDLPEGFVRTKPRPSNTLPPKNLKVVAVDCEMCATTAGHELARVTLVDSSLAVIYDKLVKPQNDIQDYLTAYSGMTKEKLKHVTTRLQDVQKDLLDIVYSDTILVGHSLQNDLNVLKLVHDKVIDTAVLYPHPKGPPNQPALRRLAHKFLGKSIQGFNGHIQEQSSHSSVEDATVCMELLDLKLKNGASFGVDDTWEHIFQVIQDRGNFKICCMDRKQVLHRCMPQACNLVDVRTDAEAVQLASQRLQSPDENQVMWVHLHGPSENGGGDKGGAKEDAMLRGYDSHIEKLWQAAPYNTIFYVITGSVENIDNPKESATDGLVWLFTKK